MGLPFLYRGVNTRQLYSFIQPLVDANGNKVVGGPYSITMYNGEQVVYANNDGSVARGVAGPSLQVPSPQAGSGSISLPTVTPSAWESLAPTVAPLQGRDFLLAGWPMTLGND